MGANALGPVGLTFGGWGDLFIMLLAISEQFLDCYAVNKWKITTQNTGAAEEAGDKTIHFNGLCLFARSDHDACRGLFRILLFLKIDVHDQTTAFL